MPEKQHSPQHPHQWAYDKARKQAVECPPLAIELGICFLAATAIVLRSEQYTGGNMQEHYATEIPLFGRVWEITVAPKEPADAR